MKKTISILLVSIFLLSSIPLYASAAEVNTYILPSGETINYYLDDNMNPYYYVNGQKRYLAIDLEHLRVTDPEILKELNALLSATKNPLQRSVNFSYIDLTIGASSTSSPKYSKNINFNGATYVTSAFLKFPANLETVRIKTTNLVKTNWYSNKKISFSYFYYNEHNDEWLSLYFKEKLCTASAGYDFGVMLSVCQYGYFYFWNDGNLTSYTANIWATM